MDLIKAKTILGRLQAMQQSFESHSYLSTLERDLMLNYLRELYEVYRDAEIKAMPELKPAININTEKQTEKESIQKTLEFKFEPELKPSPVSPITRPSMVEVKDTPEISIKEPIHAEPPVASNPVSPVKQGVSIPVSISELFDLKKGNDFTDKLNDLPLRDIHRGLGLNDRIEFINTLFGGQKQLFEQIINDLNAFKSFEEAVHLLGQGPAIHFKWDHEDRKEKATDFIRLIRRRYL